MDWKEFVADIIKSLAWPTTALIALFLLKDRARELLSRLLKLKHKDTEIEFSKAMQEIEVESSSLSPLGVKGVSPVI